MNLKFSSLGLLLRRLRDERGQSQRDVADAIGVSSGWLSRLERGREQLDDDRFCRVVIALGLDKNGATELQAAADASRLPIAGEAA